MLRPPAPSTADGWPAWLARRPAWLLLTLALLIGALPGLLELPPMDRDEARFAQASKQMLESGDFIHIWYQEEPRAKKPIGIYWLQAASVWLFSSAEAREIWAYRLPSLLGAWLACLLTFVFGRRLFGRAVALLGSLLLATGVGLTLEAVSAKTDAALLASIVAAQGALAMVWREVREGRPAGWRWPLLFWAAQGVAILLKGPVGPIVALATILGLGLFEKRWRWLAALRPLAGVPLLLLIVLPWALAVTLGEQGSLLLDAARSDFFAKLLGGEEAHGLPPGFHLLAHFFFFWPGALLSLPAVLAAWRLRRSHPALLYCLAWLLPGWLLMEAVPTKLPNYVLPLYPALALLVAWAALEGREALPRTLLRGLSWLFLAAALGLPALLVAGQIAGGPGLGWQAPLAGLLACAVLAGSVWLLRQGRLARALLAAAGGSVLWLAFLFGGYLPSLQQLWNAPRLVAEWRALSGPEPPPLASAGFREPSLVFLAGSGTRLLIPFELVRYLESEPRAVVLVTDRTEEEFLTYAKRRKVPVVRLASLDGINYSVGRRLTFIFYGREP